MNTPSSRWILVFALLLACMGARAGEAVPLATDPALEARVTRLAEELRCLVCQNQTLADSQAPLAVDLKNQVRDMMAAGRGEREVIDYLVARYGDFVLYRPPIKVTTLLLWFGPLLLLLGSLYGLARQIRRQTLPGAGQAEPGIAPPDARAAGRADALLGLARKEFP